MKFNSAYSPGISKSEAQCPKELYNYKFNSLTRKLEKTDIKPFYKEIQSYAESTKLSTKLTAYAMGDFSALYQSHGSYADVSGQSTNLATVLNTNQIAKTEFAKLPDDVKQLFNGDFAEFVKCVNNNTFEQRLAEHFKSKLGGGNDPVPSGGSSDN